jgi:hypothetical protein
MDKLIKKPTQCQKVLKALEDAEGHWVSGRYFLTTLLLSQYHARILELERKGYEIIHSPFTDEFGFKSYKLVNDKLF